MKDIGNGLFLAIENAAGVKSVHMAHSCEKYKDRPGARVILSAHGKTAFMCAHCGEVFDLAEVVGQNPLVREHLKNKHPQWLAENNL